MSLTYPFSSSPSPYAVCSYGGKISSEWEFAKALQVLEEAPEVYDRMEKWVEGADWIVWQLCGTYLRNICSAGYKGQYQADCLSDSNGPYPSRDYLAALNPLMENFVEQKLEHEIGHLGQKCGTLTAQAAQWTGLPEGIAVAVGNVDAHVTNAAANAVTDGEMVAIMGTSTCHIMVSDVLANVPGMCGVVDGGVISGSLGYEAGQSGVGDIFGWFGKNYLPEEYTQGAAAAGQDIHTYLCDMFAEQAPGAHGLVCLDWQSGNRSTLVDHQLSGLIVGLTLQTKPEEIYRALIESTAFGAKKIITTFNECGVQIKKFIAAGGLIKNKVLMQIYSDVLNMPIYTVKSEQGCALGAAIHAAVAAGAYPDVSSASAVMGGQDDHVYHPIKQNIDTYERLFRHYEQLYEMFGKGNQIMHSLREIRDTAVAASERRQS